MQIIYIHIGPKCHVFFLVPMHVGLPKLSEEDFLIQLESELKNLVGYRLLDKPRDSKPVSSSEESVKIHNRELPGTAAPSEHFRTQHSPIPNQNNSIFHPLIGKVPCNISFLIQS